MGNPLGDYLRKTNVSYVEASAFGFVIAARALVVRILQNRVLGFVGVEVLRYNIRRLICVDAFALVRRALAFEGGSDFFAPTTLCPAWKPDATS